MKITNLILLFCFFYLFVFEGFSQSHVKSSSSEIEELLNLSKEAINNRSKQGLVYAKKALILANEEKDSTGIARAFQRKGYYYDFVEEDFDVALEYYTKALDIFKSQKHLKGIGDTYANIGLIYRLYKDDFPKTIYHYNLAKKIYKEASDTIGLYRVLNNTAVLYRLSRDFYNANKTIDIIFNSDLFKNLDDEKLTVAYINKGIIVEKQGLNYKAFNYYFKARDLLKKIASPSKQNLSDIAAVSMNIANTYVALKEYKKAIQWYKKAAKIEKNIGKVIALSTTHLNTGRLYQKLGQLDTAFYYYNLALKGYKFRGDVKGHADVYRNFGHVFLEKNEYSRAIRKYNKAIKLMDNRDDNYISVVSLTGIADVFTVEKYRKYNLDSALYYRQKALLLTTKKDFFSKKVTSLPTKEQCILGYRVEIVNILLGKAECFYKYYEIFSDKKYLDLSISHYQLADTIFNSFNQQSPFLQDRLYEIEEKTGIYNHYINTIFTKCAVKDNNLSIAIKTSENQISENNMYSNLNIIFSLMEKVKSEIILEGFQKNTSNTKINLSEEFREKEREYSYHLSYLQEKLLYEESKKEVNVNEIKKLRASLFDYQKKWQNLMISAEKEYPNYYNLVYKNNSKPIELKDVQQKILTDTSSALVEYLVCKDKTYVFIIKKESITLYKLPISENQLKSNIEQLLTTLNNKELVNIATPIEKRKSISSTFTSTAHLLYNDLILPIKKSLPSKLIIIPSSHLHYLPFDVLISKPSDAPQKYNGHDYLIKDFEISYAHSTKLLLQQKGIKSNNNDKIAGFAPTFDDLIYNKDLVFDICNDFGGEAFLDIEASKSNFIKHSSQYSIYHFATHAYFSDTLSDKAWIDFSPKIDSNYLYLSEIYGLNLNSDLVVLGACQTGNGKLEKGEGLISLAHAFTYAGSRSTISTLWDANENATNKIMEAFYSYLKKGQSKSKALRQAKLDYIENEGDFKSVPLFWASLILIGDELQLDVEFPNNRNVILIVSLLFVVFGFFYILLKKSKAQIS